VTHPASDYDWRKDPEKEKVPPGYASDHYPVAIDVMPKDGPSKPAAPAKGKSPAGEPSPAKDKAPAKAPEGDGADED
jgi:hypothetical protein